MDILAAVLTSFFFIYIVVIQCVGEPEHPEKTHHIEASKVLKEAVKQQRSGLGAQHGPLLEGQDVVWPKILL